MGVGVAPSGIFFELDMYLIPFSLKYNKENQYYLKVINIIMWTFKTWLKVIWDGNCAIYNSKMSGVQILLQIDLPKNYCTEKFMYIFVYKMLYKFVKRWIFLKWF